MHYPTGPLLNLTVIMIVVIAAAETSLAQKAGPEAESDHLTNGQLDEITNKPDDLTTIKALLVEQVDAWNAGDINRFMATYWNSPELTFSSGGQTTRGWQATLDRYKKKYHSRDLMGKLRFDEIETTLLSENVALTLGRWQLDRKDDNPHGNFSLVLKKIEGNWRIVHDHSSTREDGP